VYLAETFPQSRSQTVPSTSLRTGFGNEIKTSLQDILYQLL